MKADTITRDAVTFLSDNQKRTLRVHSVFDHAINLIDDNNHLLGILDLSKDQGPISLQLPFDRSLSHILPGDLAEVSDHSVTFLRGGPQIDFSGLKPDNLTINLRRLCQAEATMKERFATLRDIIIEEGSMDGLAPLIYDKLEQNNYTGFMAKNMNELVGWIRDGEVDRLRNGLSGVLGFGPGLTPSTDDFLVGLMLVASVLQKHYINPVFPVLLHDLPKIAREKTTRISEEMIRLAALGKTSHSYKVFITGLMGRSPAKLKPLARRVIQTGATSGTDFLYGVYEAKVLLDRELGGIDAKSPSQAE